MDSTLYFLAIGIFLGFCVQTIIGFAGALIALPILLLAMTLPEAVTYITIFYFISSPIFIYNEWHYIDKSILKKVITSSFFGVLLGVMILLYVQPFFLKRLLGAFIILYVITNFRQKKTNSFSKMTNTFGFLGGLFSGLFSTGGPLYVILVKNTVTETRIFRATMFGILGFVTLIRLPALILGGVLTLEQIRNSLIVLPFYVAALILGKKVYLCTNEKLFKNVVLALLLVSGIVLLIIK